MTDVGGKKVTIDDYAWYCDTCALLNGKVTLLAKKNDLVPTECPVCLCGDTGIRGDSFSSYLHRTAKNCTTLLAKLADASSSRFKE